MKITKYWVVTTRNKEHKSYWTDKAAALRYMQYLFENHGVNTDIEVYNLY